MTPRAEAVKDGRRAGSDTRCSLARPRLDGGEHGVKLAAAGLRRVLFLGDFVTGSFAARCTARGTRDGAEILLPTV